MLEIIRRVNALEISNAADTEPISLNINYSELLVRILSKDELPALYKEFLKYLNDHEEFKDTESSINITTKALRLYIHARTADRGNNSAIQGWMSSGNLPNQRFGDRISMSTLTTKIRQFNKAIYGSLESKKEIKVAEENKKNITKSQIKSLETKEKKAGALLGKGIEALSEIHSLLYAIETLIASERESK